MKRNKPFTPYEFQIKTLKIEKANLIAECEHLTAERDRYKAERDELIQVGDFHVQLTKLANEQSGVYSHQIDVWDKLIARIRESEKEVKI